MVGFRALRLAALDVWEEALLFLVLGVIGGLLSLLILPLPFVLAGHYGLAEQIAEQRGVGWRTWLESAWANARFFYIWMALVVIGTVVCLIGLNFYGQIDALWALLLRGVVLAILVLWLLPQPLVPALYFRQEDRRVRTALRNASVLAGSDPVSILVLWGSIVLLAFLIYNLAWPLIFLLEFFAVFVSTRIVWLRLKQLQKSEGQETAERS